MVSKLREFEKVCKDDISEEELKMNAENKDSNWKV